MTRINLIPGELLLHREARRLLRVWTARLVLCGVSLLFLHGAIVRVATGPSMEVRRLSERVEELQVRFRGAEGLIGERDRLARRQEAIVSISEARRAGWYLEMLGVALTEESYLNQIELERCLVAEERTGRKGQECSSLLALRGYAPGHGDVGQVLHALKQTQAFSEVRLAAVTELPGEGLRRDVRFHVECRLAER